MNDRFVTRGGWLVGVALAALMAAPAVAQVATDPTTPTARDAAGLPPAAPQADETEDGGREVLVTGSRIVRDGFQSPTPLTILSQEDIQNSSPSNNIADFVNQLPQLAGSTRPGNSRLNLSSGQAGINALNLRNLGEIRTLVLLDGRRSVGSTVTGLVDVNTIPQMLVKSVEVVTGGASSAYGSDAVAGVVNFVLDKKYSGLKVQVDSGITDKGDGFNYSLGVAGGLSFGSGGRGHLLVSAEVEHRDGIFQIDRDWNATGYVRIQDPTFVAGVSTTPRYLIRKQVGAANSTPGGLITASAGTTANALRGTYFGQGGQVLQYQYGALTFPALTTAPQTLTQGGSWQVNDSGRRIGLDPEDDRHGIFGRLSYEVADGIELFAEAAYNRQHVFFNAGPNLATANLTATGCGTAATVAAVPTTCNAFLYNALGPARLTGVTSVTVGTTFADLPFRVIDNRREVQRYAVGAQGETELFGKRAAWDIFGQYGRANLREQLRNIQQTVRLAAATAAAFAPAGNARGYAAGSIQCLINVNASTTDDDPACVPLNRLGVGVANPAAISYVLGDPYRDEVAEQYNAGINASVTPFSTWAGDVSVAFGAEYRKEKIRGFVPTQFQPVRSVNAAGSPLASNVWSVGNFLPTNGSYDVKEAYIETVVPLGLGLEFNGAARATRYSTAGYVTTWKLGATWQPIPDIRLRATRSRDIRAPNLNDLFQGGAANSDTIANPIFTSNGANGPARYSYSGITTGNPALRPERADQWNIGGVLTPRFLPGLAVSIDYFRINLKDGINTFSAQQIADLCYLQKQQAFCDRIAIDPSRTPAPYLVITAAPFNAARQLVRGVDFDASYRLPLDRLFANNQGSVTLRGIATRYIDNLFNSGVAGTVVLNSVGVNGSQTATPKWIFRASASYETPSFSITAVGRGVSSGKYVANGVECSTGCVADNVNFFSYDVNHVSGTFYADLNLTQKIEMAGARAEFFINVTNVFDRWPLLLPETGLAANATYSDLLGRAFRIGFRTSLK